MVKKKTAVLLWMVFCLLGITGCSGQSELKDGYYTAQAAQPSHGWQEFVTITVRSGKITSVEYNAKNDSGFIKSWDNAYMRNMKPVTGTYPNEYTRNYAAQLLQKQTAGVDAIAGASTSSKSFEKLSAAVIEQAKIGDSHVVMVDTQ